MINKILITTICLAFLVVSGCSDVSPSTESTFSQQDSVLAEEGDFTEKEPEPPVEDIEPTEPDTTAVVNRDQTPYAGELRYAASWTDKAGSHLLIISGRLQEGKGEFGEGRMEVFGYQYLETKGAWEKEWSINDFVDGVGCDLAIALPKEFVRFADPDEDGILETAFIYTLDSRCDASIVSTKMMMHTKGTKLAIRGYSSLTLGPTEEVMNQFLKEEGQPPMKYKAIDKAFEEVDERHKSYASAMWDEFAVLEW